MYWEEETQTWKKGKLGEGVGGEIGCAKDVAARKMMERRIG